MEEKKKRGRPVGKRYTSDPEANIGARMVRAAERKRDVPPMTDEQKQEYELVKAHGLAFLKHLGKLITLVRYPPDDYQI